ncbi:hypothetical protein M758_5G172200 [Ceratodon purpureus]|nr:hypothetical protein M758_5G172200 [Ceratodon purpureus]
MDEEERSSTSIRGIRNANSIAKSFSRRVVRHEKAWARVRQGSLPRASHELRHRHIASSFRSQPVLSQANIGCMTVPSQGSPHTGDKLADDGQETRSSPQERNKSPSSARHFQSGSRDR